jgi:outer membrane protein assembly factor BamD
MALLPGLAAAALLAGCGARGPAEPPGPAQLYEDARLAADSGGLFGTRDCIKAGRRMDELRTRYPYHALTAEGELLLAECALSDGRAMEAIGRWQTFLRLHPGHRRTNEVRLAMARAWIGEHDDYDRDTGAAQQALLQSSILIREAPASAEAAAVVEVHREARIVLALREMYVARQYRRLGEPLAAVDRYRVVIEAYGDLPPADDARRELAALEAKLDLPPSAERVDGATTTN